MFKDFTTPAQRLNKKDKIKIKEVIYIILFFLLLGLLGHYELITTL